MQSQKDQWQRLKDQWQRLKGNSEDSYEKQHNWPQSGCDIEQRREQVSL